MRILVGVSGGVDSAYALGLLLDAGHDVEGAVLVMHDHTETDAAREVCSALSVPLHVIDCRKPFSDIVVENFIDEYEKGRTPNPCVICNSEVKFRYLFDYATSHGFDAIATGHYARIDGGVIYRARDERKDQSYMLWRVPREILARLILPMSDKVKTEIRADASERGLPSASKSDSQEICFIPDGDYVSYIKARRGEPTRGRFIDNVGNILGEHNGIINYTVGQRKGLGIALGKRVFVTAIDPVANTVTLSEEDEKRSFTDVCGMVFSSVDEPDAGTELDCSVKLRYLQPPVKCRVHYLGDGMARVTLHEPVRAITPGQSAVFYDGDRLIFGGFIT